MEVNPLPDRLANTGRTLALVAAVVLVVVATLVTAVPSAVAAGPAAGAAGSATVQLAGDDRVAVSETTTVSVVVEHADGGVGAYDLTVGLTDPGVASITDAELVGDPGLSDVNVSDDGSTARMRAALLNTTDTGRVTVARLTLRGETVGTTDADLTVAALGDENGSKYETETQGTSLYVDDVDDDADDRPSRDAPGPATTDSATPSSPDATPASATPSETVAPTDTGSSPTDAPEFTPTDATTDTPGGAPAEAGLPTLPFAALAVAAALIVGLLVARRVR